MKAKASGSVPPEIGIGALSPVYPACGSAFRAFSSEMPRAAGETAPKSTV